MYKCPKCDREFEKYDSLRRHAVKTHKIKSPDFYVIYYLNGKCPTCKCGCGEKTKWNPANGSYRDYIWGHQSRIHNNWGHNKEALEKSLDTRKERFESGEIEVWNKGKSYEELMGKEWANEFKEKISNDKKRAKKISKSLTGKQKSPEQVKKMKKHWQSYWKDEKHREEQRKRRTKYLQTNFIKSPTTLEIDFMELLDTFNIQYDFQFSVDGFLYDFRIKNILIEVDGDFYHCHPEKYPEPIYEIQKHTIEHDEKKFIIAKENNFTLLRFWESDINNNPEEVMKTLKSYIYI